MITFYSICGALMVIQVAVALLYGPKDKRKREEERQRRDRNPYHFRREWEQEGTYLPEQSTSGCAILGFFLTLTVVVIVTMIRYLFIG